MSSFEATFSNNNFVDLNYACDQCRTYDGLKKFLQGNFFFDLKDKQTLATFIQNNDYEGKYFLENAVAEDDYDTLQKLIDIGVDINFTNFDGATCLKYAKNYKMFEFLVNCKIDVKGYFPSEVNFDFDVHLWKKILSSSEAVNDRAVRQFIEFVNDKKINLHDTDLFNQVDQKVISQLADGFFSDKYEFNDNFKALSKIIHDLNTIEKEIHNYTQDHFRTIAWSMLLKKLRTPNNFVIDLIDKMYKEEKNGGVDILEIISKEANPLTAIKKLGEYIIITDENYDTIKKLGLFNSIDPETKQHVLINRDYKYTGSSLRKFFSEMASEMEKKDSRGLNAAEAHCLTLKNKTILSHTDNLWICYYDSCNIKLTDEFLENEGYSELIGLKNAETQMQKFVAKKLRIVKPRAAFLTEKINTAEKNASEIATILTRSECGSFWGSRSVFADQNSESTLFALNYFFENPNMMQLLTKIHFFEERFEIRGGGGHLKHSHALFTAPLIPKLSTYHVIPDEDLNDSYYKSIFPKLSPSLTIAGKITRLGRTLLIDGNDAITACKFHHNSGWDKQHESLKKFCGEHPVTEAFKKSENIFKSKIAKPIEVALYQSIDIQDKTLATEFPDKNAVIYVYQATEASFKYLGAELESIQFNNSRKICLHDAAMQILRGIYPDLVALFHNTETQRSYLPLIDLIRANHEINQSEGAGRIDAYDEKIRYPNLRESGSLVDLKDAVLLKDALKEARKISTDFTYEGEGAATLLQMNALARLMLVDMLILCERLLKLKKLNWSDDGLCKELAEELKIGFSYLMHVYTKENEASCLRFTEQCGIDLDRMSKQCSFWLNTDKEEGYRAWIVKNTIPNGLYDPNMILTVDVQSIPNFDPDKGFSHNSVGHDLGAFNGALPLTEFQKALYIFSTWCLAKAEYNHLYKK